MVDFMWFFNKPDITAKKAAAISRQQLSESYCEMTITWNHQSVETNEKI